jgi:hypothetical protein
MSKYGQNRTFSTCKTGELRPLFLSLMPFLYGILETLLLELFSFNFQIGATDVGADTHIKTGPLLIDRNDAYYQYTHRKKISIPLFFIT